MWEFDEAVEVRSSVVDDVESPEQFLWRGRLWRVCSVQAHWTETAAWWERGVIGTASYDDRRDPWAQPVPNGAATPVHPRSRAERLAAHAPGGGAATYAPAGTPQESGMATVGAVMAAAGLFDRGRNGSGMATSPAAVGVLDADWGPRRAVYRVEAGCGRHGRRELFDLAHDPDSGRWQLERVTDR
ncbi:hypothetical protein E1263_19295 [Kribbella antibiotica]|uniref:DUF6504 domain-containing protein n=1 Tax=Kribbella antibiotica TaxID=190195 RepID=A0A4R4ZIN9_9ACTN|nr:DUF6504 family protein [Kribbella antibiotica]TDD58463.1 hypothetical protein E1263_19295 [Kribbella antibiotica]